MVGCKLKFLDNLVCSLGERHAFARVVQERILGSWRVVVVWTHEVVGAFLQPVPLGAVELLKRLYACGLVEDLAALR